MRSLNSAQSGFTLIELLIATSTFAVVLVIILFAFLFISDDYLRGSVESQTQSTTRALMEQITQEVQLDNATVSYTEKLTDNSEGVCIGDYLYSYVLNQELAPSSNVMGALVVTPVDNCSSATPTLDVASNAPLPSGSKELLGNNMRLGEFCVTKSGSSPLTVPDNCPVVANNVNGQYDVNISVAYGNSAPSGPLTTTSATGVTPYTYSCPDITTDGEFCATSMLSSIVQQRTNLPEN